MVYYKKIGGVEFVTSMVTPVSRAEVESLKKKEIDEWKIYVKQYPKVSMFKFSIRIFPGKGKYAGKFWLFSNNTVHNLGEFERCVNLTQAQSACKGIIKRPRKKKSDEEFPEISLAMFPRKKIQIQVKEDLAKQLLDAAYKNVLSRFDASYFGVSTAKLFYYPNDDFPTLKFWVGGIEDRAKWNDEGNKVRRLELPLRYNVDVDEF